MLRFLFENILERAETPIRLIFLLILFCCPLFIFLFFLLFTMRFRFLPWNFFFFCFLFNFFFSFLERLWWKNNVNNFKLPDAVGIFYGIFTQRFKQVIVLGADNACWMFTFNTNVVPFLLVSLIPLKSFVTPVIYDLGHVTVLRLCCRPPMRILVINKWQSWG